MRRSWWGALGLWAIGLAAAPGCAPEPGPPDIGSVDAIELCVGEVDVPDAALRAFLLTVVAQPEPDENDPDPQPVILAENLRRLRGINAPSSGIKDLTGLQCAQGVLSLGLANNEIEDLRPLLNLTGLTQIELSNNKVTDLRALGELYRLERVALDGNGVTDLSPLAQLHALSSLDLAGNGITDIGPLAGLTNLEVLVLSDNEIQDLDALADLTALFGLQVTDNAIQSLAPLAGLTSLSFLDLEGNAVTSLSPLAAATQMRELEASRNALTSLAGVEAMTELTRLVAQENAITSTAGVEALVHMSVLDLGDNQITALPGVHTMLDLRRLAVPLNRISDISAVAGLAELRDLDVRFNEGLSDLSAVGTLPLLGFLGAGGYGQTQDLSALAGRTVLRALSFQDGRAGDLSFFGQLPALESINFSDTPLSADQLQQIAQAKTLQTLTLRNTGITDMLPLAALPLVEVFDAAGSMLTGIAPAAAWTNLQTLRLQDNPLQSLEGLEAHEILSGVDVSRTPVADLSPLVANETFRQGDTVVVQDTALDEGDCPAIAAIEARNAVVTSDVACG